MFRMHTAASRRRLRGYRRHTASGAKPDATSTPRRGSFSRRRTAAEATPAATRAQAVTLMALDARKDGPVYDSPPSGEGPCEASSRASTRTRVAKLECRALRPARVVRLLRRRIPHLATILGVI